MRYAALPVRRAGRQAGKLLADPLLKYSLTVAACCGSSHARDSAIPGQHDRVRAAPLPAITARCRIAVSRNNGPNQGAGSAYVDRGRECWRLPQCDKQRKSG